MSKEDDDRARDALIMEDTRERVERNCEDMARELMVNFLRVIAGGGHPETIADDLKYVANVLNLRPDARPNFGAALKAMDAFPKGERDEVVIAERAVRQACLRWVAGMGQSTWESKSAYEFFESKRSLDEAQAERKRQHEATLLGPARRRRR